MVTPPDNAFRFNARFLVIDADLVTGTLAGSGELEELRFFDMEEALALDRAAANPYALAADLELLGRLYAASGRGTEARSSWERALRIVQTTGQVGAAARLQAVLGGVR